MTMKHTTSKATEAMRDSNSQTPSVSIVVPCFNAESTLRDCLDSLISQKAPKLQIVCIDDGSTDETQAILSEYAFDHPGTFTVCSQNNLGSWSARLKGLSLVKSDYTMFLDSDDIASPGLVDKMLTKAVDEDADLVICGFQRINTETGNVMSSEFCSQRRSFHLPDDYSMMLQVNPAPWNKIFKSSLFAQIPNLSTIPVMFDDLCLLLLFFLNSDGPICFLPEPLVEYRVHNDSSINSATTEQVEKAAKALKEIRGLYEASITTQKALEAFDALAFSHLGVSMPFRLIKSTSERKERAVVDEMIKLLDNDFPLWRESSCLSLPYALEHKGIFAKAHLASKLAKFGLLPLALSFYEQAVRFRGKDISW